MAQKRHIGQGKTGNGLRRDSERTRQAILKAAVAEFATEDVAGARTDAIARAAGVNKALLYYYFKDKETLHGAVLDHVFAGLTGAMLKVLEQDLSPGRKLLAAAAAHFDYIASSPLFPRVVMNEMTRAGRQGSPHLPHLVRRYFRPVFTRLTSVMRQGIAAGEIRPLDPAQFLPSMVALNVFYFSASPVVRLVSGRDPLTPARVRARRAAVLDFISAALFARPADRKELQCERS